MDVGRMRMLSYRYRLVKFKFLPSQYCLTAITISQDRMNKSKRKRIFAEFAKYLNLMLSDDYIKWKWKWFVFIVWGNSGRDEAGSMKA